MESTKRQSIGWGGSSSDNSASASAAAARRLSWLAPRAIVVLDEADILISGTETCCGREHQRSCVVRATSLGDSSNSSTNNSNHSSSGPLLHLLSPFMTSTSTATPTTEAYPVALSIVTPTPSSLSPHLAETGEAMPVGHLRPEYIYVKVMKGDANTFLGIALRQQRDRVIISRIKRNGLLSMSPLRPGDQILAVNGISCIRSTSFKVAKLIRNARKSVSIVAWNREGDPNLVSCTVQKPAQESKVGVCIKNDHGAVRVSRVHPDGLFAGSLLLPGHRCVQINGMRCDGLRSRDAASMISLCSQFVTIVSRPKQECAMVLSCEVHKDWWWKNLGNFLVTGAATVSTLQSVHV